MDDKGGTGMLKVVITTVLMIMTLVLMVVMTLVMMMMVMIMMTMMIIIMTMIMMKTLTGGSGGSGGLDFQSPTLTNGPYKWPLQMALSMDIARLKIIVHTNLTFSLLPLNSLNN